MRAITAVPLIVPRLLGATPQARAQSPVVAERGRGPVRYHEQPQKIDEIKAALEKAPSSPADGNVTDVPQARALRDTIKGRS